MNKAAHAPYGADQPAAPTQYTQFCELFEQLGLPSGEKAVEQFIRQHRPIPGPVLLIDAPFWTESQRAFLKEKKATDSPEWMHVIEQLNTLLREPN